MATVRVARPEETERLATIWHEAWHQAHGPLVPAGLVALRTVRHFTERVSAMRLAGRLLVAGEPALGFAAIDGDEVDQLMVAREGRGSGVAPALLAAACERIGMGHDRAWLLCAVGNERARRFYEREGWLVVIEIMKLLPADDPRFPVPCWRMERPLPPRPAD